MIVVVYLEDSHVISCLLVSQARSAQRRVRDNQVRPLCRVGTSTERAVGKCLDAEWVWEMFEELPGGRKQ